ncbi:MAG TPA: hypothetical protein VEH29_07130 [Acidimicrobiales bacterium]|nr:hypothetical protein [Acidimicrobiales bacterium]
MSRRASLLLRASVLWTVWIWLVLIRNMVVGNFHWSFKLIHIGLAVVSLAFAAVTWQITTTSRRFAREVERERNPKPERLTASQLARGVVRLGLRKRAGTEAVSASRPSSEAAPAPVPSERGE